MSLLLNYLGLIKRWNLLKLSSAKVSLRMSTESKSLSTRDKLDLIASDRMLVKCLTSIVAKIFIMLKGYKVCCDQTSSNISPTSKDVSKPRRRISVITSIEHLWNWLSEIHQREAEFNSIEILREYKICVRFFIMKSSGDVLQFINFPRKQRI